MMSPRLTSRIGEQVLVIGPARSVGQLVHQQMVADQQRVLHRPGGDDERLYQRRGAEQQQNDGDRPLGDDPA